MGLVFGGLVTLMGLCVPRWLSWFVLLVGWGCGGACTLIFWQLREIVWAVSTEGVAYIQCGRLRKLIPWEKLDEFAMQQLPSLSHVTHIGGSLHATEIERVRSSQQDGFRNLVVMIREAREGRNPSRVVCKNCLSEVSDASLCDLCGSPQ